MQSRRTFIKAGSSVAICVLVQPSAVLAQSDSLAAVVREYAAAAVLREGRVNGKAKPKIVKRKGVIRVICSNARHKQRQG